jgi:hypothetical protein
MLGTNGMKDKLTMKTPRAIDFKCWSPRVN